MELDRSETSSSLAPGFRFHPTDEELVSYYLKRKVCGKPFRFDAISDVDVYKTEPWDLPGLPPSLSLSICVCAYIYCMFDRICKVVLHLTEFFVGLWGLFVHICLVSQALTW